MKSLGCFQALLTILFAIPVMAATPSGLAIRVEHSETDQVWLTWLAEPGRLYNVLAADTLRPAPWKVLTPEPILASTNFASFQDTNLVPSRFYQVAELLANAPAITVAVVGSSVQFWLASDSWDPSSLSTSTSDGDSLVTIGVWWDEIRLRSNRPSDSKGTFVDALDSVAIPLGDALAQVQIAYETQPLAGTHVVVPPEIGASGDGYMLLLKITGIASDQPIRDRGLNRVAHPFFGAGDPKTIQSISVSTGGSAAQVGDLALAVFVMDNNSNPNIKITLPSGWTSLGFNDLAVDNVGYRACYRIVTEPGRQSAACSWTDDATFVAEGGIVVFPPLSLQTR